MGELKTENEIIAFTMGVKMSFGGDLAIIGRQLRINAENYRRLTTAS